MDFSNSEKNVMRKEYLTYTDDEIKNYNCHPEYFKEDAALYPYQAYYVENALNFENRRVYTLKNNFDLRFPEDQRENVNVETGNVRIESKIGSGKTYIIMGIAGSKLAPDIIEGKTNIVLDTDIMTASSLVDLKTLNKNYSLNYNERKQFFNFNWLCDINPNNVKKLYITNKKYLKTNLIITKNHLTEYFKLVKNETLNDNVKMFTIEDIDDYKKLFLGMLLFGIEFFNHYNIILFNEKEISTTLLCTIINQLIKYTYDVEEMLKFADSYNENMYNIATIKNTIEEKKFNNKNIHMLSLLLDDLSISLNGRRKKNFYDIALFLSNKKYTFGRVFYDDYDTLNIGHHKFINSVMHYYVSGTETAQDYISAVSVLNKSRFATNIFTLAIDENIINNSYNQNKCIEHEYICYKSQYKNIIIELLKVLHVNNNDKFTLENIINAVQETNNEFINEYIYYKYKNLIADTDKYINMNIVLFNLLQIEMYYNKINNIIYQNFISLIDEHNIFDENTRNPKDCYQLKEYIDTKMLPLINPHVSDIYYKYFNKVNNYKEYIHDNTGSNIGNEIYSNNINIDFEKETNYISNNIETLYEKTPYIFVKYIDYCISNNDSALYSILNDIKYIIDDFNNNNVNEGSCETNCSICHKNKDIGYITLCCGTFVCQKCIEDSFIYNNNNNKITCNHCYENYKADEVIACHVSGLNYKDYVENKELSNKYNNLYNDTISGLSYRKLIKHNIGIHSDICKFNYQKNLTNNMIDKYEKCVDILNDSKDRKVIIMVDNIGELNELCTYIDKYDIKYKKYYTLNDVNEYRENKDIQVFIITTHDTFSGLSFAFADDLILYNTLKAKKDLRLQIIGRINRIGHDVDNSINIYNLLYHGE